MTRAAFAVECLETFLTGARSIQDANGNQIWVTMFTPDIAVHICNAMGWELAVIGRDTRDMQAGELEEKQKEERRIIVP